MLEKACRCDLQDTVFKQAQIAYVSHTSEMPVLWSLLYLVYCEKLNFITAAELECFRLTVHHVNKVQ